MMNLRTPVILIVISLIGFFGYIDPGLSWARLSWMVSVAFRAYKQKIPNIGNSAKRTGGPGAEKRKTLLLKENQ
jgi:hypothetical protein